MSDAEPLHAAVERAALDAYWPDRRQMLDAVRAAVAEERRIILDCIDVLAQQADCVHQR